MASTTPTHLTIKKTYFHSFFPVKSDEEAAATPNMNRCFRRMIVEIRDVRPPPVLDPRQPWQIKKALVQFEVTAGKFLVSFNDTFEYILRYWDFCMSHHVAILWNRVAVSVWDDTNEKQPRKYAGNDVYFQCMPNESYALTCMGLVRDRNLKVDDYVGLHWDPSQACFRIKLFYSNTRS